jgi:hypothetical protein
MATIELDFYKENFNTDNKTTRIEAGTQIEIMRIALGKILEQNFLMHTIESGKPIQYLAF